MREKLKNAPWWVWSLIEGAYFGTFMAVFVHWREPVSWSRAIIAGLVMGVFFGAVMGPIVMRQRRIAMAAVGGLSAHDQRIAGRAVTHGPAPLDPDIRQAAARLAARQLRASSRARWLGIVVFVPTTVLYGILALTSSPWWWVAAAGAAALSTLAVMWPRHLQRRVEILSHGSAH